MKRLKEAPYQSNVFLLFAMAVIFGHFSTLASDARKKTDAARTLYEKEDFTAAAKAFEEAIPEAEHEKLDPAPLYYNRGNALYKDGQFSEAMHAYERALRTDRIDIQSDTYFNRGNSLMNVAAMQEQQQQLDKAVQTTEQALEAYENSLMLAPENNDAKINLELALKEIQRRKKLLEQQQQKQQQEQDQNKENDQQESKQNESTENDQQQNQQQQEDQQDNQNQQQEQDQQNQQEQQDKNDEPRQSESSDNDEAQQDTGQPQEQRTEQMTPEEARMMLEAMEEEEQARRVQVRRGQPVPVDKNW